MTPISTTIAAYDGGYAAAGLLLLITMRWCDVMV
jgi:hypothetical protein